MLVYRITKSEERGRDLSGFGAYKFGGRWNDKGIYMLYTSENSSLAYLENLVHFDSDNAPPQLYVTTLELNVQSLDVYELPAGSYPANWQTIGSVQLKSLGDNFIHQQKYIAMKVRSAINTTEYNYLLNPLFAGFGNLVTVKNVDLLAVDVRLIKY